MNTEIEKVTGDVTIDAAVLQKAGRILKNGGLVAFPTETVYGVGGDALQAESSKKVYAAKGRPSDNPLIVLVAEMQSVENITRNLPKEAYQLAEAFWPGPLTMVLKKNDRVPYETTGGQNTVAVRMPGHPVTLALIRAGGGYVTGPSANSSGRPSPTEASHVYEDLSGKVDLILDGGSVELGMESTIIDLTGNVPTILRPGCISQKMIAEVIGEVKTKSEVDTVDHEEDTNVPGMKYKHYAPNADLLIVEGNPAAVIKKIDQCAQADEHAGKKVGIIATEETAAQYQHGYVVCIGARSEEAVIARNLYSVLRDFDALEVDRIYSESFYTPQMGEAIMNRLLKAAGHHVIKV
ncbi:MAG: L-threonylcarbamoyladenylate synthase [Lachnospiraceae bacterium]